MNSEDYSWPLNLRQVRITDRFWGREQELVRKEVIPYQWEALNDRIPDASPSYCMHNFKAAGKLMREKREAGSEFIPPSYTFRGFEKLPEDPANPDPDRFYGFVFQDSDFSKWIEAVGYSLANYPDPRLEQTADEAIDIVCAAQAENGYLDTYYIINGMDRIFTNLRDHHELYCFGHLAEGAVSYYQATGKDKLLRAAMRYGNFIAETFGPEEGKCKGYPGHEIAEMALAKLYEVTGERKYLELSRFFLDMRGRKPYYFDVEEQERAEHEGKPYKAPEEGLRFQYHQAHLPVRQQTEAVGHAVRGVYLYSGMADVARLTQDGEMYEACRRLWDSIVNEKLYITGGIGGTHVGEAFSYPYDLPNDTVYSETCAAIGLAFFARRMLQIQADHRYGDVMEQALYNTVLAGMALDGKSFFYVNPLEAVPEACEKDERKRHVKNVRQKWFGCACCPPNIARIISSLGMYAYTCNETTLFTHLYLGSSLSVSLNGNPVELQVETDYPWDGEVKITLHTGNGETAAEEAQGADELSKADQGQAAGELPATLAFRIPGWCKNAGIEVRRGQCTLSQWTVEKGKVVSCAKQLSLGELAGNIFPGKISGNGENQRDGGNLPAAGNVTTARSLTAAGNVTTARNLTATGNVTAARNLTATGNVTAAKVINGLPCAVENMDGRLVDGYIYLTGKWRNEDRIYLTFPMDVRCVRANTRVREDIGKAAFLRGPVCFCMEEADNGKDLHLLRINAEKMSDIEVERSFRLGHEMCVLKVPGYRQEPSEEKSGLYTEFSPAKEKETTLTYIPYYAWSNRGEGEMSVWAKV